ncbi:MAG TPA: ECF-type sigma factor [Acidobacteriaceae bacterium]|nr:ECF-type sigma factor [Acidobacteriaceae bacterium]
MGLVYGQLHLLAQQYMRQERPDHTLRATALVHEAYLRLVSVDVGWKDRAHFLAVAAITMRRILIDHARSVQRVKRGSGEQKLSYNAIENEAGILLRADPVQVLYLDAALNRLLQQDSRKAKLMEMIYFGGLNCDEAAVVLEVSVATVNRDLKLAKAWLKHELRSADQIPVEDRS